ncbi:hypothetical protein TG4357_03746 [Thalassovita gelatinovora]|uniref:Uncharacterized protein n=1 Tax=Thalassovita gelatinovora TaxID=53501 RepID=A0A0P1FKM4_THAGE|nr:hypothetical protein [Thalassovita gelatinovora]QIZ79080.1 hypothetical protein HFZ77_00605 [Thalassovita gelatinovora]CUH68702.1 hypothetical protein TG4357_03746 [Thalassovita gelatinovora]SEQ56953.1 hypothetical protein SAMN04488043_106207 [Thalassovita gelatinovora]
MKITLKPVRHGTPLILEKSGDVLNVNGVAYDFSALPDGATYPRVEQANGDDVIASDGSAVLNLPFPFAGDITREGGELHVILCLPHDSSAPEETKFPAPITVTVDGPITLPPHSIEDFAV